MTFGKKIHVVIQPEVVNVVGGAISIFFDFCKMLSMNGYIVTGICYADLNIRPDKLDVSCKFVNLKHYYKNQTYDKAFNMYLEEDKPDLLVFFFRFLLDSAKIKDVFNSIPKILMFHSRPDVYFLWDKSPILPSVYKNTTLQILFNSFYSLLPESIFNVADGVFSIPNPVVLPDFSADLSVEKKKIVYLSRVDRFKGLEFLIDSFSLIANKYPDWSIDIYGQSQPPEYLKSLQGLVKQKKLHNQIFFKGLTASPLKTMLNYDFCVFPSYFEGFGMGLAEALSVGLPAIGLSGCSGVNELIIDEYNGYLTKDHPELFATKIEKLINNKDLRIEFGKNARQSMGCYNHKDIHDCWLKNIDNILNRKLPKAYDNYPKANSSYELFPLLTIEQFDAKPLKWHQKIFSLKNSANKTHKIVTILGFQIKIKRNKDR